MIVLVEGPDNSGKGTQITRIKKWMEENVGPTHYFHYSNIKGIPNFGTYIEDHYMNGEGMRQLTKNEKIKLASVSLYKQMFDIMKMAAENEINLILDRAHLGETVYSPLYREYEGDFVWVMEHAYSTNIEGDPTEKIKNNESVFSVNNAWYDTKLFVFYDLPENLIKRDDGLSFSTDIVKKTDEVERFKKAFKKSCLYKSLICIDGMDEHEVWLNAVLPHLEKENELTDYYKEFFK